MTTRGHRVVAAFLAASGLAAAWLGGIVVLSVAQGRTSEGGRGYDLAIGSVELGEGLLLLAGAVAILRGRRTGRTLGMTGSALGSLLALVGGVVPPLTGIPQVGVDAFMLLQLQIGLGLTAAFVTSFVWLARSGCS